MNRWRGVCAAIALVYSPGQAIAKDLSNSGVEVGIYNVQNLFDTTHDRGKRDYEFLPAKNPQRVEYCKEVLRNPRSNSYAIKNCKYPVDWNNEKLKIKIEKIKEIFVRRGSSYPDVLMLSEVENSKVLRRLGSALGYDRSVISSGPDKRGIDVAFLFKSNGPLRYFGKRSYKVNPGFATRPILEVEFRFKTEKLRDRSLFFYANHWPAQTSRGNSRARVIAAKTLLSIMRDRTRTNPDSFLIAMGDFNTTETDYPNPIKDELLGNKEVGLYDVDTEYRRAVERGRVPNRNLPAGTYYWKGNARLFDRFIISKALLDGRGLEAQLESYEIFARKFNSKPDPKAGRVPLRYNHYSSRVDSAGYSDHYPVFVQLGFKN